MNCSVCGKGMNGSFEFVACSTNGQIMCPSCVFGSAEVEKCKKEEKEVPEKEFYMLYVDTRDSPTKLHFTLAAAEKEAERLARKEGKRVYILVPIKSCVLGEVLWEDSCEASETAINTSECSQSC